MTLSEMTLEQSYAFSPVPADIWPEQTHARYCGQVSYDIASRISNVGASHASALAYLPAGTSTNPATLSYRLFKVNDTDLVMADVWINQFTLKQVTTGTRTIVLSNASAQDDVRIRSVLSAAGFLISSIN